MKKSLSKVMVCTALLCLCSTQKVKAAEPLYISNPLASSNMTVIAAGQTSNAAVVIDVSKQRYVGLSWMITAGGCTNESITLSASVDGTVYDTNHWVIGNLTAGTAVVTNIDAAGFQFIRLDTLVNTGSKGATNTVSYSTKIPGS